MNFADHIDDPRQRVADYAAVLVLTRAAAEGVAISTAQLGAIVAEFLPILGSDTLKAWSELDMAEGVRTIKVDLLRHEIARVEAHLGCPSGKRKASRDTRAARAGRSGRQRRPVSGRHKLSEQEIGRLDEDISRLVVSNFFKFMTMTALDPGWFTPYLARTMVF